MTVQEFAVGQPLANKYGSFGVSTDEVAAPESMFGMIVGPEGSGKSSLFRDAEGCLVVNVDLHSVPKPSPDAAPSKAQFFPAIKADGRYWVPDGTGKEQKLLEMTWNPVHDLQEQLINAARKDLPRPKMIVFDTVKPIIPLRKRYVVDKGIAGAGFDTFEAIPDGNPSRTAWGYVYDGLVDEWMALRAAGYGVWIVAHLVEITVKSKDGKSNSLMTIHNIPNSLYDRFSGLLEFKAGIHLETKAKIDSSGALCGIEKNRYLVNLSEQLNEKSRSRVSLPDRIKLPANNAWDHFREIYIKAASSAT